MSLAQESRVHRRPFQRDRGGGETHSCLASPLGLGAHLPGTATKELREDTPFA